MEITENLIGQNTASKSIGFVIWLYIRINHTKICDIQCSSRSDRIKWFMHSVALDRTALGEMHSNRLIG